MSILAIDPGTKQSAYLILDRTPRVFGILPNEELADALRSAWGEWPHTPFADVKLVVIEKVEGFGMRVGREIFETVFWSGIFAEAARPIAPVERIGRLAVKRFLIGKTNGNDAAIRAALLERFGGGRKALGTPEDRGPLFGVTKDVWSALAVAVTAEDRLL